MIKVLYAVDADPARDEVVRLGGRVLHVLTTRVLVADLPHSVVPAGCSTEAPADLDQDGVRAVAAWAASGSRAAGEAIPWDTPGPEAPG